MTNLISKYSKDENSRMPKAFCVDKFKEKKSEVHLGYEDTNPLGDDSKTWL